MTETYLYLLVINSQLQKIFVYDFENQKHIQEFSMDSEILMINGFTSIFSCYGDFLGILIKNITGKTLLLF